MTLRLVDCLALLARLALAALFLYSGGAKIAHQQEFYHTLQGYQLLPAWASAVVALYLPWVEVMVGLFLLVGYRLRRVVALAAALLVLFMAVIASAVARGITLQECGCFPGSGPPGPLSLARDAAFLLLCLLVYARGHSPLSIDHWSCPWPALRLGWQRMPLARKIALLVSGNVAVALLLVGIFTSWALASSLERTVGRHMLDLARTVAAEPEVRRAYASPRPSEILQPLSEQIRSRTKADLVVFLNMDRIRYSHFDPDHIGKVYTAGDEARALRGESYVARASCVGGPSVRGLAPIYDESGRQVGVVVVGMFLDTIAESARDLRWAILLSFGLALVVGSAGALALARNIKTALRGLEPSEIASLLQQREAMLGSIREGVVAVDRHGRLTLSNDSARKLLGLDKSCLGRPVSEVIPSSRLTEVVRTGTPEYDQEQALGDLVIITNRVPIVLDGEVAGAIATFRDKTEVTRLAEELTGVRRFAEALRAQNHEFHNKLQVVAGLIELGAQREALDYITWTTRKRQGQVRALLEQVREPLVAGLLLGKFSEAEERGITLIVDPATRLDSLPRHFDGHALVLVLGNLIQNAFEAVGAEEHPERREVRVSLTQAGGEIVVAVENTGAAIPPDALDLIFEKGWSTKGEQRGLGLYLVRKQVERAGGRIGVVSRPERGTRFEVRVPQRLRAASQPQAATKV